MIACADVSIEDSLALNGGAAVPSRGPEGMLAGRALSMGAAGLGRES